MATYKIITSDGPVKIKGTSIGDNDRGALVIMNSEKVAGVFAQGSWVYFTTEDEADGG